MTQTYDLTQTWKKIASGGNIVEIQNRTSDEFEIYIGNVEPETSDKGFIVREADKKLFLNASMWARSKDGTTVVVLKTIPSATELNNAIHAGTAFALTATGTIAANSEIRFLAKIGEKQLHFDSFNADLNAGDVTIELFREPTVTNEGTPVSALNLNCPAGIESETDLFSNPTVSDDGTSLHISEAIATGTGTNADSATAGIALGRVFSPNSYYMVRIKNLDVNAARTYSLLFVYHESAVVL